MAKRQRSFILRIWFDETEPWHGQVSDPHSDWRQPFHTCAELWAVLSQAAAHLPQPPSSGEEPPVFPDEDSSP